MLGEDLLLHPFLHPVYEDPEMDSVWVVGEAYHALGVEACGEGEEHHKMALEEV